MTVPAIHLTPAVLRLIVTSDRFLQWLSGYNLNSPLSGKPIGETIAAYLGHHGAKVYIRPDSTKDPTIEQLFENELERLALT